MNYVQLYPNSTGTAKVHLHWMHCSLCKIWLLNRYELPKSFRGWLMLWQVLRVTTININAFDI